MRTIYILLFLFPICTHAQVYDTVHTVYGYTDALGMKQGTWQEKALFPGIPDSMTCSFTYLNSQLSGACSCNYPNGQKACSGTYVDGKADGYWLFFKSDGEMDHTISYHQGEIAQQLYYTYTPGANGDPQLKKITYKNAENKNFRVDYYENNILVKSEGHAFTAGMKKNFLHTLNLKGPWGLSVGYTYQNSHWLELGIKKYCRLKDHDIGDLVQPVSYLLAGTEMGYKNKKVQVAPKIGVGHYNFLLFNFNLNCILYNDRFQTFYPAITPEIGISFPVGVIQINYGYTIFLTRNTFMPNETHRISLHINIPFFSTGK
ncbi:MAG: hypothetical protein JWP12_3310 [Bacteroidetes bacterium]|nr:hypothetical protein [Bacteroidota bacterium]